MAGFYVLLRKNYGRGYTPDVMHRKFSGILELCYVKMGNVILACYKEEKSYGEVSDVTFTYF